MPPSMPAPHRRDLRRRDLRRWERARRRHRTTVRRRTWVAVAAVALVAVGVGAHTVAPDRVAQGYAQVSAWVPGHADGRQASDVSRSTQRTPAPAGAGGAASPTPTVEAPGPGASTPGPADQATPTAPAVTAEGGAAAPAGGNDPGQASGADQAPAPVAPGGPAAGAGAAGQPPSSAPAAASSPSLTQQIVELTNAERAAAGLPALAVSSCAAGQAQARTDLLVAEDRFEHDPLGPVLRACAAGSVGENLALGYADAAATVTGWMNSPGHRENILRAGYTSIGVACTLGSHGQLCAQVFLG
ncbi:CAP domain-containing protein [Cellulomonas soli]